jgi:hypothetical protein
MNPNEDADFVSFDCEAVPDAVGKLAAPRPADRPCCVPSEEWAEPSLLSFDCESVKVPPGTLAAPRPAGKERPTYEANDASQTDSDASAQSEP